jgi:Flp pilus assembly protein TadG/Mg-chelatase subunit ChlD
VVFSAFLMVMMMAMLALSIDVGYIFTMQTQLQRAVDAAALAGAQDLVHGLEQAENRATEYLVRNPVGSSMTFIDENQLAANVAAFKSQHASDLTIQYGNWNPTTGTFTPTTANPSALTVTMTYPNMPFFFGKVLGKDTFSITASATAMYQPRDIVLVLDYSASMNDDSTFAAIGRLSREVVEGSLLNCWNDLGPPTYGNLTFTPQWAVAQGVPENTSQGIPHITVEYRNTQVYVTSTKNLTTVRLQFSNNATQSFSPSNTQTGTFAGTGSNANLRITKVWVRSWNNSKAFGANGELFDFTSNTTFLKALGLDTVSYPYPNGGSWNDYINYCISSSSQNYNAGYQYKFGGMNLMNYWLEKYPAYSQVPDLWKVRAEPLYGLKYAVNVFADFIQSVDSQDRVGLVIYNAPDGNALVEIPLTTDVQSVVTRVYQRQAGHYHSYTNIGAGMKAGREHLDSSARPNAFKMMVLMTDGLANWYNGQYNVTAANNMVAQEAALAAARKYRIMTIALGVDADTSSMQSVASTTGGTYFRVPGGANHQVMHDQLYDAFKDIADARPLLLVK